ncbi:hypothetical protein G9A89_020788 [Geosiphon pyriformis]|nr:hypothetical protein G9A89_020788 [Geosiphon pyriformis]
MEAMQYQALVDNNWLFKINNNQHTHVPATCDYFKPITTPLAPLIKFEEEEKKPIWKAYQVFWANKNHNKLLLILSWNNNKKEKQKEDLIWNSDQAWRTDNDQKELITWEKRESNKRKRKKKEEKTTPTNTITYNSYTYTIPQ